MEEKKKTLDIDFKKVWKTILEKKWLFVKVWAITFILSCIWILPQPRYYTTEVSVAPEGNDMGGGNDLATLASNFGVNIGSGKSDAIYPQLYPDLFKSTDFLVGILDIQVQSQDGKVDTDYYTYLKDFQKKNILTMPLSAAIGWIESLFGDKKEPEIAAPDGMRFNPFHLSKETTDILGKLKGNIRCSYSKTTNVITISVTDQDPQICALMADSIKERLQVFITDYRTKKSRIDYNHYCKLTHDARTSYDEARRDYASYADSHQDVFLQSVKTKMDDLESEMQLRFNVYSALNTRKEAALAKVQENTPVFTTLTNATIPVKPAGPKRMIFVATMLFLATIGTIIKLFRKELLEWF